MASPLGLSNSSSEIQRLTEDLMAAKTKLASWEESWAQAKQACDAWKKEAEESAKKAKEAEQDKLEAIMKKEEVNLAFCQCCSEAEMPVLSKGQVVVYLLVLHNFSPLMHALTLLVV